MKKYGATLAIVIALIGATALPSQAQPMTEAPAGTIRFTPPPPTMPKDHPIQTGMRPSAYTGKYYREVDEQYRRCTAQREGRFQYWTTGSNGYYESTYQMTDALVRGASWMIQPELVKMYGPKVGKHIARTLRETQGRHWHRFYMDMAFWTILNWNGPRSGAHHWAGGRFVCKPGMSSYPVGR